MFVPASSLTWHVDWSKTSLGERWTLIPELQSPESFRERVPAAVAIGVDGAEDAHSQM